MKLKGKLVTLGVLIIVLIASVSYFPGHTEQYSEYVFFPFQSLRNTIFGFFPISFGDVLYFAGGVWLLVTLIKWVYYIIHFKLYKPQLISSGLNTVNTLLFVYLLFLLGWGFNYDKIPLRTYWELDEPKTDQPPADSLSGLQQRRAKDSVALVAFDSFLVDKLNIYAPYYKPLAFHITDERARAYYRICTDSKVRESGVEVKHSLYSYFMERMAIDGYYNPFTGEGQVNSDLPGFVLPFVICHEMAHQAGIAAEGDANLMAYALGTLVNDTPFNYSCYLNIWLYTNNRLFRRDSMLAKSFEASLNKITLAHIDTLEQISRKYNNTMTRYSGAIFDSYLKLQDQKDGIKSYGNVVMNAWQLEQKRKGQPKQVIRVP